MVEVHEQSELVSVVIPTYFRNDTLKDAIESALGQTHEPVEVIVVDDSGTENAKPVVSEYPDVTYIPFEKNRGAIEAREVGGRESSGAYVQFLDDDDMLESAKFAEQLPVFTDDVGVVYSGLTVPGIGRVILPNTSDSAVRGDVLEDALRMHTSTCNMATMLIRRDEFEEILPLKNKHDAGDLGMKIELARITEYDFVEKPLARVRDTPHSMGTSAVHFDDRKQLIDDYSDLYDRYPEHRREALRQLYWEKGVAYFERNAWALGAILSFLRTAYYADENRANSVAAAIAALFGRPGFRFGKRIVDELRDRSSMT